MTWLDPNVSRYLIADEGEVIVDEVAKHPIAMVRPVLWVFVGIVLFATMPMVHAAWWVFLMGGLGFVGYGLYRAEEVYQDRFVITNMRVFRVHGIFQRQLATMPMSRILDIAVTQPFTGRVLGYGHFVFESAAQDQGLREINFVPRPNERDQTIQRVIARAGLRPTFDGQG